MSGPAALFRPMARLVAGILLCALPLKSADEYELKAQVLRIIGSYVSWPNAGEARGPFTIGVFGDSPFAKRLDDACRNRSIRSRSIRVVYLNQVRDPILASCEILFICASEAGRLPSVLSACKGRPIFLMGDTPGFAQRGVMLNLQVQGGTLALEINLKAAREADLEISPTFLALSKDKARRVDPD